LIGKIRDLGNNSRWKTFGDKNETKSCSSSERIAAPAAEE